MVSAGAQGTPTSGSTTGPEDAPAPVGPEPILPPPLLLIHHPHTQGSTRPFSSLSHRFYDIKDVELRLLPKAYTKGNSTPRTLIY